MKNIDNDLEHFIKLSNYNNNLETETLMNIGQGLVFFKFFGNSISNSHYLDSLIQDGLTIIDALSKKSERYYHFILRSYIENFMRVLLALEDDDPMGIMKLFNKSKKLLEKYSGATEIFDYIEKQYDECCLFVHSNIRANVEISVYLKMIMDKNDFKDITKPNLSLKKFEAILTNSVKLLLICRSDVVDNSFYRNKDILKMLISKDAFSIFTKALDN